jgi:hypothetical protein
VEHLIAVVPHYWQTGRFRSLCAFLLLILGPALFLIVRLRYLRKDAERIDQIIDGGRGTPGSVEAYH